MTHTTVRLPLDRGFNAAILHIANKLNPRGWSVEPGELAPSTLADLTARALTLGRLSISGDFADNTIFGDREVNLAFRAWHDWCHFIAQAEFTPEGERQVYQMQCETLIVLYGEEASIHWRALLDAEIVGQVDYVDVFGEFPPDQVVFDRGYLSLCHPGTFEHYFVGGQSHD